MPWSILHWLSSADIYDNIYLPVLGNLQYCSYTLLVLPIALSLSLSREDSEESPKCASTRTVATLGAHVIIIKTTYPLPENIEHRTRAMQRNKYLLLISDGATPTAAVLSCPLTHSSSLCDPVSQSTIHDSRFTTHDTEPGSHFTVNRCSLLIAHCDATQVASRN